MGRRKKTIARQAWRMAVASLVRGIVPVEPQALNANRAWHVRHARPGAEGRPEDEEFFFTTCISR